MSDTGTVVKETGIDCVKLLTEVACVVVATDVLVVVVTVEGKGIHDAAPCKVEVEAPPPLCS